MRELPGRFFLSLAVLAAPLFGGAPIDENDRVVLRGDVHLAVARAEPVGRPDPAMPLARMILALTMPSATRAGLETLLAQQQDPASPLYHQWLTPEAFGARFGAAPGDVTTVVGWLESRGFTVEPVGSGRTSIVFSGNVQQVEDAFQTLILDYRLGERTFHANATEPSIPRALAGVVHGVVSLHNLPHRAMHHGLAEVSPEATATNGVHYLAPGDFATIYNVQPLYNEGITGKGVSVAVVGRTHPSMADITSFRSTFKLPALDPEVIVNGPDPGDLGTDEDAEADLDLEWSGAVAQDASILFVTSASTLATDGVDLSAEYIVDNDLAPVMTVSFGGGEQELGASENSFYDNLWAQAAAQGITVFVSSGDSGAAGDDSDASATGSGQDVSGLASPPYAVCVGGTEFNDAVGAYWSATNSADEASALGYIPEAAWNQSGTVAGGSDLYASGGGASGLYAKPGWQVAPGVPADGRRDVPDVALNASTHDGYLIELDGKSMYVGGTSCGAPCFAGLMALVVQATGQRQGNANPALYLLGNAQYRGTGPAVFHDILTGNNSVPGTPGFTCGPGYDQVTGLGSVNAQALVGDWSKPKTNTIAATILAPASAPTLASGAAFAFSGTAKDSSASATLTYAWNFGDGTTATGALANHAFTNTGKANATFTVTLTAADNTGVTAAVTCAVTVRPASDNTVTAALTSPAGNVTVATGAAVAFAGSAKDSSSAATLTYVWNFGDGTKATGASTTHTFNNTLPVSVTCTVTFTATDNTGMSASATREVTVQPAPKNTLTAAIAAPAASLSVASGTPVAFAGTAVDSSSTVALTYAWNFGDGTKAAGATASHAFTNTGASLAVYTVILNVTDNTGVAANATCTVTVLPAPVTSAIKVTLTSPSAQVTVASGTSVAFAATATDANVNATLAYAWTAVVAGSTQPVTLSTSSRFSMVITNDGAKAGTVEVLLTVTDNKGAKAFATCAILVNPASAG